MTAQWAGASASQGFPGTLSFPIGFSDVTASGSWQLSGSASLSLSPINSWDGYYDAYWSTGKDGTVTGGAYIDVATDVTFSATLSLQGTASDKGAFNYPKTPIVLKPIGRPPYFVVWPVLYVQAQLAGSVTGTASVTVSGHTRLESLYIWTTWGGGYAENKVVDAQCTVGVDKKLEGQVSVSPVVIKMEFLPYLPIRTLVYPFISANPSQFVLSGACSADGLEVKALYKPTVSIGLDTDWLKTWLKAAQVSWAPTSVELWHDTLPGLCCSAYAGHYHGNATGTWYPADGRPPEPNPAAWECTVYCDGHLTGTSVGSVLTHWSGAVDANGKFTATASDEGRSGTFEGTVAANGSVSGKWSTEGPKGHGEGEFSGARDTP